MGSLDTEDILTEALCAELGAVVVSVGYRLAPESPYPADLDDCMHALRWFADHAGSLIADAGCHEASAAVLLAPLLGPIAGTVLADVMFGRSEPGGRLPSTFPRPGGQIPSFHGHPVGSGYDHPTLPPHGYIDLADRDEATVEVPTVILTEPA
jgi:hypothetical protein